MIVALNNKKERVFAFNSNKKESYFCCNSSCSNPELILCKGKIVSAYFRHKQKDFNCNPQPESIEHELAKLCLVNILNLTPDQIESTEINGIRPDILYNPFGIEFQKSKLSIKEFRDRTRIYLNHNKIPLWFFYYKNVPNIGSEIRLTEIQLIYGNNIPYFTFIESNKLCFFFLKIKEASRFNDYIGYDYSLKKTKEITNINIFEINSKEDFDKMIQHIDKKWFVCTKCGSLKLLDKTILNYTCYNCNRGF
jgi:competence CoiA-like predicted nuclease